MCVTGEEVERPRVFLVLDPTPSGPPQLRTDKLVVDELVGWLDFLQHFKALENLLLLLSFPVWAISVLILPLLQIKLMDIKTKNIMHEPAI